MWDSVFMLTIPGQDFHVSEDHEKQSVLLPTEL